MSLKITHILTLCFVLLLLIGCVSEITTTSPSDIEDLHITPTRLRLVETAPGYPSIPTDWIPPYPYPNTPAPYPPAYPGIASAYETNPSVTTTPSITPTPTLPPTFTVTATLPPYSGKAFSIVLSGDGLRLVEIGGKVSRLLTHEPENWFISYFDINPRGDRIAYIAIKRDPDIADAMIKQIDLKTGKTNPLVGMNDGVIEYRLKWLDDNHLAYSYEEFPKYRINTPSVPTPIGGYHPYKYIVYDIVSGKTNNTPNLEISWSPDSRYQITCTSRNPYEPDCEFTLLDLISNTNRPIAQELVFGRFLGWSFDSQWMLFMDQANNNIPTEQRYLLVAPATHLTSRINTGKDLCTSITWAYHRAVVACTIFDGHSGVEIRFWGPDGSQIHPAIPLPKPFQILSWTPDDSRLLIYPEDHTLWIINIDGTGLQQIFSGFLDGEVLPQIGY